MKLTPARRRRDPDLFVLLLALLPVLILGWPLAELIRLEDVERLFSESGPIERSSALCLIAAALLLAGDMTVRRTWNDWHMATLALAAGLRELDWDKAFTDSGILSLRLYSGAAPLGQKVLGGLVVALLVWAGLRLLRRTLRPWMNSLREGQAGAWMVALAMALQVVAKTLDGLGRKLAAWGIDLVEKTTAAASRAEEVLELFGAVLILQAVATHLAQRRTAR